MALRDDPPTREHSRAGAISRRSSSRFAWGIAKKLGIFLAPVIATSAALAGTGNAAALASAPRSTSSTPFLLGVALPLTGDEASYGVVAKDTIELAQSYVNAHGGVDGHPLQIDWWDTQALPATGVAGTQYFISHHVNAVVGYFDSSVTIPAVRGLETAGIPLFGDNPSTPALAQLKLKNFVRVTSDDQDEGYVQAGFAWSKHYTTAVTIDDDEIFGDAFTGAFTSAYEKLGGKVLKAYVTQITTTNFGSVLAQLKSLHPDLIEYSGFNPAAALLLKQARADGIATPYITDSSQVGTDFTNVAGKSAVGAYMTDLGGNTDNPFFAKVSTELRSKYHQSLSPIMGNEYDAVLAVQRAAQVANSISPSALIPVMHKISFTGTTGKVSFIADGDRAQVKFIVVQVSPSLGYNTVFKYSTVLQ